MVKEEGPSSLLRGAGPNVFRAVLMNASQLASYDFFKAELLRGVLDVDSDLVSWHFRVRHPPSLVTTD